MPPKKPKLFLARDKDADALLVGMVLDQQIASAWS